MRVVFVHGINNQGRTGADIEEEWWGAIVKGWKENNLSTKPKPQVDVAVYGDILANRIEAEFQTMGNGIETASAVSLEFLRAYQNAAGISDEELQAAYDDAYGTLEVQEQGILRAGLVRLVEILANMLPDRGKGLASMFLKQAITYIDNVGVRKNIHAIVNKQIFSSEADPTIVISHSLGTVVSYNLLVDPAYGNNTRNVPLFLTLGSPLAIGMMDTVTPSLGAFPTPPIGRWTNAFRDDDFVSLNTEITKKTFGFDHVENIHTDLVDGLDPHSIEQYLADRSISRLLHEII